MPEVFKYTTYVFNRLKIVIYSSNIDLFLNKGPLEILNFIKN